MPGKIILTITTGPKAGSVFVFEEHDVLLLGRKKDCHVYLPEDQLVSRHHFILEVNPPEIRIRDLGSLHGTFINGQKYGGRQRHETPEYGTNRTFVQVDLHDGDEVRAGQTIFRVQVEAPTRRPNLGICLHCREKISLEDSDDDICATCKQGLQDDPGAYSSSYSQQAGTFTQAGHAIADYQIIRELGRGGMSVVYLAQLAKEQEQVALKFMPSKVAIDERSLQRFQQEMEATSALRHPNIITFLDSGTQPGVFYFLMEYCEGGDLASLIQARGGHLSLEESGPILLQTLKGLAFAHENGFVHRDIKPQNILLRGKEGDWQAKLADLGLAKNFERAGFGGLTVTGEKHGTLLYMPPEQVKNFKQLRPVSDVWSMGATCYFALTGTYPRNYLENVHPTDVVLSGEIIPIRARNPEIPRSIAEVIDCSLANEVNERFQHAGEMYEALAAAQGSGGWGASEQMWGGW